jgi:hypothetical protein
MSDEQELKIEEFKEMVIGGMGIAAGGAYLPATFRFDDDVKNAKVSFDNGNTWVEFLKVKRAIDAFVDRHADKLEL